ncbi:MAG: flavodoxin [Epulopiscium sp. Nuni2H_MBin003]|nr:MAG: flavodoxin [Epulopiscium sp. Nuni2H_MBin003]
MSKVAVVYWSGTGNTEAMAKYIAEGAQAKGAEVSLLTSAQFNKGMLNDFAAFAFGCPSMGAEVLEEEEFQPMWDDIKDDLEDKKYILFGSYGWGDGEWMRNWEEEAKGVMETYICNDAPNDDAQAKCKELGESLA